MNPPTNNWRKRRTRYRYEEIVTDITTRNSECKDTYKDNTKNPLKDEQHGTHQKAIYFMPNQM